MDKYWKQVTTSDYAWEIEALAFAKEALPDHEPYRAWSNFEFIAQDGSINEIDLLVLTPKGLFLVEIKSHPGVMRGDAGSWVWEPPKGRTKYLDNPRILADRKAKKLASLLQVQSSAKRSKERVPFISAMVFLSAENLVNKLEGPARINVTTRKNFIRELTYIDANWHHKKLNKPIATMVSRAMEEAGIKESLRMRRVGLYELTTLLDETDAYQEWLARHTELEVQRKVRIYFTYGKSQEEAMRLERAAKLEFRLLEGIEHPGILKAYDYQQHDHGPALVYEYDAEATRLDHRLLDLDGKKRLDMMQAISLLRNIAEAVQYAHEQKLHHRALSPQSIYVKQIDDDNFNIKIGNWATAERFFDSETQQVTAFSHLTRLAQDEAGPYIALEAHSLAEADGVHMDVFSLGAIAYHLFTGKKPAENDLELQDKLSRGVGLQVTDEINGASKELQELVAYATHPDPGSRLISVEEFLEYLDEIEEEITRPDTQRTDDPTQAQKDDTFEGGITVKKRLGKGACSVVFLVEHKGRERVLKVAISQEHNRRIAQEGETLSQLRHHAIIAYHETLNIEGHTCLLIDYASSGTLAQRLRATGAIQLELLERFGDDLLTAISHIEDKAVVHRDIKPENIGLLEQGSQLHLVLFDFSLSNVGTDNITAGTVAYMDPFLRDTGRRRWDDFAERFSAALTLYEMAAGALPSWVATAGLPHVIEGEVAVDGSVFEPTVREKMVSFFKIALARDVKNRFANAGDMLKAWRQIYIESVAATSHPSIKQDVAICPIDEAQLDTQIGLLELSPQALDTLSRRNINTVEELIKLNRSQVRVWPGVGVKTRTELSEVIALLQTRLIAENKLPLIETSSSNVMSVDRLMALLIPKVTKATDEKRQRFINEYLGRLEGITSATDPQQIHWPSLSKLSAHIGFESSEARSICQKLLTQWGKLKPINALREEIISLLAENGGVMTAIEIADAILLRRGCLQQSPVRERWVQAVVRVALETESSKQEPRCIIRRSGNRFLIADDQQTLGEELADYARDMGEIADECAQEQPLLSPVRALEMIRAVPAPETFSGLSNHRLLRLAAAASQKAALSSRAEFYPQSMAADQALELAQGALLGSMVLTVEEVQSRVAGRYPAAAPLPGRPRLDELIQSLDMGFKWEANNTFSNGAGYCLPRAGLTMMASQTKTQYHFTCQGDVDTTGMREIELLEKEITAAATSARFLALTVQPKQMQQAKDKLCAQYTLFNISFDELLLRHLQQLRASMSKPLDWNKVLNADVEKNSREWLNLQRLVQKVLPAMAQEIQQCQQSVLLTDPGLIARYDLVSSWLNDLRQHLMSSSQDHGLILLIAADAQRSAAVIDDTIIPAGAGSTEWVRIPSIWLKLNAPINKQQA
ncbi:MAG: BREX system serine/threonine kinase PglW [Pseudomonadales bacterium]|nr:BREX system serine/threonine kinase PglW [Pseudomonadales bacterium]